MSVSLRKPLVPIFDVVTKKTPSSFRLQRGRHRQGRRAAVIEGEDYVGWALLRGQANAPAGSRDRVKVLLEDRRLSL